MSTLTADLICPRCGLDVGMVIAPPLAVCLGCGLPLRVELPVTIVQALDVADVQTWSLDRLADLRRLIMLRDRAVS